MSTVFQFVWTACNYISQCQTNSDTALFNKNNYTSNFFNFKHYGTALFKYNALYQCQLFTSVIFTPISGSEVFVRDIDLIPEN